MRTPFDQFAKQMLEQALSAMGQVTTDAEVLVDVQRVDVWYVPDPQHEAKLDALGLLGRMAAGPCRFEPFHQSPGIAEVLGCVRKQLSMEHSAAGRTRYRITLDDAPVLWVISAGRPDSVLRDFWMKPLPGWLPGIYTPPPALRARLVAVNELPVTRETLLVRLMGAGRVLREAIDELKALPRDAWERDVAMQPLLQLRLGLPDPDARTDEERELAMSTLELYERWRQRILDEGLERGMATGLERGMATGLERGMAPLARQFERRLGRALTEAEHATLRQRLDVLGAVRLGDVVLDLDPAALSTWLADSAAM